VDEKMLVISNQYYASQNTILFQRISVLVTDLVLFFAVLRFGLYLRPYFSLHRFCKITKKSPKETNIILAVTTLNCGLIFVDNIHFQYNGMLLGILVLSMSFIFEVFAGLVSIIFSFSGEYYPRQYFIRYFGQHEAHFYLCSSCIYCLFIPCILLCNR
jgi:alpha-1,3-glucosyltransferase